MEINRLFVYGTLMSGMRYHALIKPYISRIVPARTTGRLYDLPEGYPAMVPGTGTVVGELLELNNVSRALKIMDDIEDYLGPDDPGNLYVRTVQEVEPATGTRVEAYVYIWAAPEELPEKGLLIPDGDWRAYRKRKAR